MWRTLLACVVTAAASNASAQVFECINLSGDKEYSRFCPPGTVQQRQISKGGEAGSEAAPSVPAGPAVAPKSIEMREAEFRQRLIERQEVEAAAEAEKTRAEEFERNCLEARTQLRVVMEGQRMQRFDPATGERIQFTDEDRAEAAERQRKAIAQWCK